VGLSNIRASVDENRPDNSRKADLIRERLGAALRLVDEIAGVPHAISSNDPVTDRDIRSIIKQRRNRDHFFGAELFADPAWDILLHLYAAYLSQHRLSVGDLCDGAAVPPTTALRWLAQLEEKGFVERRQDPVDGRRFFVSLTVTARESMENYFRTIPRGQTVV
jgi:DNA-binding MarR family transcriptional regulator